MEVHWNRAKTMGQEWMGLGYDSVNWTYGYKRGAICYYPINFWILTF
jgi:hypothetical protein